MQCVADLHLHSKYSRAVSKNMVLPTMAKMAAIKGIDLLATGDFTHPVWFSDLQANLEEVAEGIYAVKGETGARYILGTELACIYSQDGKGRRVHLLVFAPNLKTVEAINNALKDRGYNLSHDGRPIMGISVIDLCKLLFDIDENITVIPAHIWTPWFGILGSKSGFDSVRETFGEYAEKISAIETGLSSDPAMNWRIEELKNRSIVSFSDAHSPEKFGRELTVFEGEGQEFTYTNFRLALQNKGPWHIGYTVEFYPEEGKYHVNGHRACNVIQTPEETHKMGLQCPVCGKPLTLGVLSRVDQLGKAEVGVKKTIDEHGIVCYAPPDSFHKPYIMLVPLAEILAEVWGKGVKSKKVIKEYDALIEVFGSELNVLMKTSLKDIADVGGEKLAEGIRKVRSGDIYISPGYDGVFGTVKIWGEGKDKGQPQKKQMTLF